MRYANRAALFNFLSIVMGLPATVSTAMSGASQVAIPLLFVWLSIGVVVGAFVYAVLALKSGEKIAKKVGIFSLVFSVIEIIVLLYFVFLF